jgi:sugar phosphate permease
VRGEVSRTPLALSAAQKKTLFVVWLTYGAFYVCRVNIGPARVEIERSLALGALEMGFVLGALKIGYAIGQLVNGQLAERFGPRRVLLVGMIGSVCACLAFAGAPSLAAALGPVLPGVARGLSSLTGRSVSAMAALLWVVWFANGYFQAGGWPPCVKVMEGWFTPAERGRVMGVIGTSYQVGSALTIIGAGALVSAFGDDWRAAFAVPAALLFAAALHARARLRERPEPGEAVAIDAPPAATGAGRAEPRRIRETLWLTLTNGRVWILALALFGLDVVRYGFLDWAPGHLKATHGSGALVSALKVAVFPLAGAVGALASGWATDRWFQSRRGPVIAVALALVAVLTLAYGRVSPLGAGPTVACLAGVGFALYGAQILLVGTAAQDFAKKHTAAASAGFVDFMGYMGAFGGDVVTGYLLKHAGYPAAIRFWAGAAIVAAALAATLWRARPVSAPS